MTKGGFIISLKTRGADVERHGLKVGSVVNTRKGAATGKNFIHYFLLK
jgi:hypothetical protein